MSIPCTTSSFRLSAVQAEFGGPGNLARYFRDNPLVTEDPAPLVPNLPANRNVRQFPISNTATLTLSSFRGARSTVTSQTNTFDYDLVNPANNSGSISPPVGSGRVVIKLWGGGGGGAVFNPFTFSQGGSGGGGGFVIKTIDFNPCDSVSFSYSVGIPGAAGGVSGGNSSVTINTSTVLVLTAGGGGGGQINNIQGVGGSTDLVNGDTGSEKGGDGIPAGFGGPAGGWPVYTDGGGDGGNWSGLTPPSAPGGGGAGAQEDNFDPFLMTGAIGRIIFEWS